MTNNQPTDVKIIMVGAINVGKTSLVTKYASGKNPGKTTTTKNASFIIKKKNINGINYNIKLWDTAGQEKYKSLTQIFMKDSKIALLVYSIDSEESFQSLDSWLELVKKSNDEDIILGLIANKVDLASDKTISNERGQEYAKKIGATFKATSAILENENIDGLIDVLFQKYYQSNLNKTNSLSLTISMDDSRMQRGGCCGGGGSKTSIPANNKKVYKKKK
jgi:small GTP-binding protein